MKVINRDSGIELPHLETTLKFCLNPFTFQEWINVPIEYQNTDSYPDIVICGGSLRQFDLNENASQTIDDFAKIIEFDGGACIEVYPENIRRITQDYDFAITSNEIEFIAFIATSHQMCAWLFKEITDVLVVDDLGRIYEQVEDFLVSYLCLSLILNKSYILDDIYCDLRSDVRDASLDIYSRMPAKYSYEIIKWLLPDFYNLEILLNPSPIPLKSLINTFIKRKQSGNEFVGVVESRMQVEGANLTLGRMYLLYKDWSNRFNTH